LFERILRVQSAYSVVAQYVIVVLRLAVLIASLPQGVLTPDVNDATLRASISQQLDVAYLSNSDRPIAFPVSGKLIGYQFRPMINLAVQYNERSAKNVIFLVDAGSMCTFICPQAVL
jgi:hypothetical protein